VKCQASVTEYLMLVIMIVFIALIAMVMMFGFQLFSVGSEQMESQERKSLFMLQSFISSTILNNPQYQKGSVFDDSRLTVATCDGIEALFGHGLWAEVRVLPDEAVCNDLLGFQQRKCLRELQEEAGTKCTTQNYPQCSIWTFCDENKEDRMMYRSIPVNVYRKMNSTLQLGVLTVGTGTGD
jgi:hypothetical protein